MAYTAFDPKSIRSILGLKFQKTVLDKLELQFPNINFMMTWEYFKKTDASLTDKQLSYLEKEFGDITYEYKGQRHYIECCLAMGKNYSKLCEMKRLKFVGSNKWYCYGFKDSTDIIMIPSRVWKKYVGKIKKHDISCRLVSIYSIQTLRAGVRGLKEYWEIYHNS
jgi:hypothetical protein